MSSAKSILRSVKNYAKGYSDIQIKVRTATSNDAWGPSGALMAEIADATYSHRDFLEIMEMIDKRLNDHGKNWRHVYKALILLEFLLQSGSEAVLAYAKDNLYVVKTLKEFQYIDDEGRDQGMNVRQKSKDVTALLNDEARVAQLRESKRNGGRTGGRYNGDVEFHTPRLPGGGDNDDDLQKAIEESKKTARLEETRRKQEEGSDEDLQRALELSEREAIERRMRERDSLAPQLTGNSDQYQPPPPKDDFIDFFAPVEAPPPDPQFLAQQQMIQQQQQRLQSQLAMQQQAMQTLPNPFMASGMNPFMAGGYQQQPVMPMMQPPQSMAYPQPVPQQQQQPPVVDAGPSVNMVKTGNTIDPFASLAASRTNTMSGPSAQSQQSSYNPFGGNTGNSSNQSGPGNNGLVNLDASSLGSSNAHQQLVQENAIKNPFGPKLQPQSIAGSGKFQWDNKPAPMTLAQMAASSSGGGRSNTNPGLQHQQQPLFGNGAPNASWTTVSQPFNSSQPQMPLQQHSSFGNQMMGGFPQQQPQQQQFGGGFPQQQQQRPQFGGPYGGYPSQPPQQQQQNQQFQGQKPTGYQGSLF